MKCPKGHEMVCLLTSYVCDVCDGKADETGTGTLVTTSVIQAGTRKIYRFMYCLGDTPVYGVTEEEMTRSFP